MRKVGLVFFGSILLFQNCADFHSIAPRSSVDSSVQTDSDLQVPMPSPTPLIDPTPTPTPIPTPTPTPPVQGLWTPIPAGGQAARNGITAAHLAGKVYFFGGNSLGTILGDFWAFDVANKTWQALSTAGAPSARYMHATVGVGNSICVFGGISGAGTLDGGCYNVLTGIWQLLPTEGAPSNRSAHTAVAINSNEVLIYGGLTDPRNAVSPSGETWILNIATRQWRRPPNISPPGGGNCYHSAVWTGARMLVFNGARGGDQITEMSSYDPATGAWSLISLPGGFVKSSAHRAVWTGLEMVVFGGQNGASYVDPHIYNPVTNTWRTVANGGALPGRQLHAAAWTAQGMFVFAGNASGTVFNSGALLK